MSKKRNGRPPHQLDYETLDKLCAIMCTRQEIAALMEIDEDTLTAALKRDGHESFSAYFKKKSASGKMSLRRKQYGVAMKGNVTMLIWLGKQQLGQMDKVDNISSDGSLTPSKIERYIVEVEDKTQSNEGGPL